MKRYDPSEAPDPGEWLALDEMERQQLVEAYHRRARIRLPNERIHAIIHVIVENQIASGDEFPVRRTIQRLMREGLDRHEAVHAVGMVLSDFMFDIMKGAETADAPTPDAYDATVERLTAESWRKWRDEEDGDDTPWRRD